MLKLANNRAHLWQWDADQTLVVERADVTEVHFRDLSGDTAMVLDVIEQDGKRVVQIPNILLKQARTIDAYACRMVDGIATLDHVAIEVKARQRPADYVYTETEVKRWETLEERIAALEEAGSGSDSVSPTVEITPIEGGHQISITDVNGTHTADVMDGKDGEPGRDGVDGQDGQPGADGISPTVAVQDISGGHRVTITDKDGAKTFDVMDGKDGTGGGGGSAVQADWNVNDENDPAYVKNRTHWVERPYEPIVWDGNTEGRDSVDVSIPLGYPPGSVMVYKISDRVLTKDELAGCKVVGTYDGVSRTGGCGEVTDFYPGHIWMSDYHVADEYNRDFVYGTLICTVVAGDFMDIMGVLIPSTGTYAMQPPSGLFPHSININSDTYHHIDKQYLPDTFASVEYVDNAIAEAITGAIGGSY